MQNTDRSSLTQLPPPQISSLEPNVVSFTIEPAVFASDVYLVDYDEISISRTDQKIVEPTSNIDSLNAFLTNNEGHSDSPRILISDSPAKFEKSDMCWLPELDLSLIEKGILESTAWLNDKNNNSCTKLATA